MKTTLLLFGTVCLYYLVFYRHVPEDPTMDYHEADRFEWKKYRKK